MVSTPQPPMPETRKDPGKDGSDPEEIVVNDPQIKQGTAYHTGTVPLSTLDLVYKKTREVHHGNFGGFISLKELEKSAGMLYPRSCLQRFPIPDFRDQCRTRV